MNRRVLWAALPIMAVVLGGCDNCESARRDSSSAWAEVTQHALDEAAGWGQMVVEEMNKGRYGVPEVAAKERDRWRKAYETAQAAKGMAVGGLGWTEELKKAHDQLSVLEPPRTNKDWQKKLAAAKTSSHWVDTVCTPR